MIQKLCDICGKIETRQMRNRGDFHTGFRHNPPGIKEACCECHAMLAVYQKRLTNFFEEIIIEMMKEIAVRRKKYNHRMEQTGESSGKKANM